MIIFLVLSLFKDYKEVVMNFWNYFEDLNLYFVNLTQLYSEEISLAFVATCLVLFGDNINGFVSKIVKKYLFLFRILIFILLCAVGYGLMTVILHPIIHDVFLKVPRDYSFVVVAFCFIYLGIMVERKRIL